MTMGGRLLWTFDWSWTEKSRVTGLPVEYGETMQFDTDREAALRAHESACQGRWVTPRQQRPCVGPLVEWELPAEPEGRHQGLSRARRVGTLRDGVEVDEQPHPTSVAAHR